MPRPDAETQLRKLLFLGKQLSQHIPLQPLLTFTIGQALELFAAERGCIALISQDQQLHSPVMRHLNLNTERPDQVSTTAIRKALETRQPVLIPHAASDPNLLTSKSATLLKIRSVICAPLIDNNRLLLGAIYLESTTLPTRFTETNGPLPNAICKCSPTASFYHPLPHPDQQISQLSSTQFTTMQSPCFTTNQPFTSNTKPRGAGNPSSSTRPHSNVSTPVCSSPLT